jgi:mono/diheme cytochrome c family protein
VKLRRLLPPLALLTALVGLTALTGAACSRGPEDRSAAGLYAYYCARCHGARGEGDPRNVDRSPGLDLTRSLMVERRDTALIRRRIAEGRGPMPGFSRRLSPEEIEELVRFTLQFQHSRTSSP